ncbi:M20/M25/M40 family metallo-hydrolase [Microbaculum marinum]|uniref:M20/M25/M40 family metallo-hydrolase n=1 Tax=Microbaculum marinum TaxID=1764581 RepID=A0AAW9RHF4_9HYPH
MTATEDATGRALAAIDAGLAGSLDRLFELIRIPSISTDPAHNGDCRKAADWVVAQLRDIGFDSSARETGGQPMVVGHYGTPGDGVPHVLFYGHYDVQPADPIALWEAPPFEPRLVDGPHGKQIVARGASDDKGQFMTFIEACRGWVAGTGSLPIAITVLIEGEEESGSNSLGPFLDSHKDELTTDFALVCDTGMWDAKTPAITTMLRGLLFEEFVVTAANRDLHSGMYGGAARNPISVVARIVAALHDDNGRIQVPHFYDGVEEIPADIKAQWDGLGFSAETFLGEVGLAQPAGETGRSVLEQIWSRPTCDVNGIIGGYTGEGSKTVIASKASAKVSFRLVGEQDPLKIRENFRAFVKERVPADCKVQFIGHAASPALKVDTSSPQVAKAAAALEAEFERPTVMMGCGGSIPIVGDFKRTLGLDSVLIGFGLDDDKIHSPNEKYNLSSFHHGARAWARVIGALAEA